MFYESSPRQCQIRGMRGDGVQKGHEKREEEAIRQWGLTEGSAQELGERLAGFWGIYGRWTRTRTRDGSQYGLAYVSGLLRMEEKQRAVLDVTGVALK